MPVTELIVKYRSDISELQAKVSQLEASMKKVDGAAANTGKTIKTEFDKAGSGVNSFKEGLEGLGKTLVAAFAIEQVVAFGNKYVEEFGKAQKAAFQLLGALGGNEAAQKRLLDVADKLSGKFAIDNDVIVDQEKFLAVQGRTESQIKKTIEAAIQLSAVTGEDLGSSIQKLDATFEGNIGRLGKLDSRFSDLSKTQLANGEAVDLVLQKYQGFAEKGVAGVTGELQRAEIEFENTAKRLGEAAAPIKIFFQRATSDVLSGIEVFINTAKALVSKNQSILNPANWFGANNKVLALEENKRFLQEQTNQARTAFENFNADKLALVIKGNIEELQANKTLSEQQRIGLQGEINAASDLLRIKQQAALADKTAVETLDTLKKKLEDLKSQQEKVVDPLGAGKGQNDALLKSITATERRIDEITGKAAEDRAKAALDAKKKAADELAKADKDRADRESKGLADALEIDLADLEAEKQRELGLEERSTQEKLLIDIDYLRKKQKLYEDDPVQLAKINAEIAAAEAQLNAQKIKDAKDTADAVQKQNEAAAAKQIETAKRIAEIKKQIEDELVSGIEQIVRDNINQGFEERMNAVQSQRDAELSGLDAQISANEDARSKDQVSLRDYEANKKKLLDQRVAAEKKADRELAELKTKQAIATKVEKLFEIAISTARNAISQPGPLGAFIPYWIALGAIEAGIVLAQPIPKFEKGTKSAHSGATSLVGERGPEFMFVPQYSNILDADKTKKYSSILNAMHDNRLQEYLDSMYLAPALRDQKVKFEQKQQQIFAQRIANSFMVGAGGLTANEMDFIRRKGTTIKNAEELADLIADKISKVIPQSSRRYN